MMPNNRLIFRLIKTPPNAFGISRAAHNVLIRMVDCWNPKLNGAEVWPSYDCLAFYTGYSRRQITQAVQELQKQGLIKTQRRQRDSSIYTLQSDYIKSCCDTSITWEQRRAELKRANKGKTKLPQQADKTATENCERLDNIVQGCFGPGEQAS